MKAAKEKGIHTCLETSGYADTEKVFKIAEVTDLFLYDWKITDEALHKKYIGVSNLKIKENLFAIDGKGKDIILRCPVIHDINDNEAHFDGIAEIANTLKCIKGIDIEPYHALGVSKAERLGKTAKACFENPDVGMADKWVSYLRIKTKAAVKIG